MASRERKRIDEAYRRAREAKAGLRRLATEGREIDPDAIVQIEQRAQFFIRREGSRNKRKAIVNNLE